MNEDEAVQKLRDDMREQMHAAFEEQFTSQYFESVAVPLNITRSIPEVLKRKGDTYESDHVAGMWWAWKAGAHYSDTSATSRFNEMHSVRDNWPNLDRQRERHEITVWVDYTSYKKERKVRPVILGPKPRFGSSAYYPFPQWLLPVFDLEHGAIREFAVSNIHGIYQSETLARLAQAGKSVVLSLQVDTAQASSINELGLAVLKAMQVAGHIDDVERVPTVADITEWLGVLSAKYVVVENQRDRLSEAVVKAATKANCVSAAVEADDFGFPKLLALVDDVAEYAVRQRDGLEKAALALHRVYAGSAGASRDATGSLAANALWELRNYQLKLVGKDIKEFRTMPISPSEACALFEHPAALRILADWHSCRDTENASMDERPHGAPRLTSDHEVRCNQLRSIAERIVAEDPDIWGDDAVPGWVVASEVGNTGDLSYLVFSGDRFAWTGNEEKAIHFSRRYDAEQFSNKKLGGMVDSKVIPAESGYESLMQRRWISMGQRATWSGIDGKWTIEIPRPADDKSSVVPYLSDCVDALTKE